MITINGKQYPLWSQFVEQKDRWIGGTLYEIFDAFDAAITGQDTAKTTIKDIALEPCGEDCVMFSIVGEDFTCGFNVKYGGVDGSHCPDDWICFSGVSGGSLRIKEREAWYEI